METWMVILGYCLYAFVQAILVIRWDYSKGHTDRDVMSDVLLSIILAPAVSTIVLLHVSGYVFSALLGKLILWLVTYKR